MIVCYRVLVIYVISVFFLELCKKCDVKITLLNLISVENEQKCVILTYISDYKN